MSAPSLKPGQPCFCGSGHPYGQCCQPWHLGQPAPSAEALMRSRYVAYCLGLQDYLLATWHPGSRPAELDLHTPPQPKWLDLEIRRHLPGADSAQVEFIARYRLGGRAMRLHETSRFRKEDGRWYYVDGDYSE
ncbi:MAG: hypothetical protein RIR00_1092 [Pseudomonadota bacterium]|jgi:SEC-C motif-containing protein